MTKRAGYRGSDGTRRRVNAKWEEKVSGDARKVRLEDEKRKKKGRSAARAEKPLRGHGTGQVLDTDWDED